MFLCSCYLYFVLLKLFLFLFCTFKAETPVTCFGEFWLSCTFLCTLIQFNNCLISFKIYKHRIIVVLHKILCVQSQAPIYDEV